MTRRGVRIVNDAGGIFDPSRPVEPEPLRARDLVPVWVQGLNGGAQFWSRNRAVEYAAMATGPDATRLMHSGGCAIATGAGDCTCVPVAILMPPSHDPEIWVEDGPD